LAVRALSPGPGTISGVRVTLAFKYRVAMPAALEPVACSHLGGSRFAYNHLLSVVKANWDQVAAEKAASGDGSHSTEYVSTSHFGLLYLWQAVRDEAAPWWGENSAQVYNDAAQRLSKAFANWRAGRAQFPTYRRRQHAESVKFSGTSFAIVDRHHVRLSRIGAVKTYESMRKLARHLERGTGRVVTATLKRESGGWFVVFTADVERPDPPPRTGGRVVGLDVGLSTLVTGATPDGRQVLSVANPRNYQRSQAKLAHAQRVAARRQGPVKGQAPSNRWRRANRRVQNIHAHVRNQRLNTLHQVTSQLVKDFDVIVVEDLNVKGMTQNRKLAKHIADASWSELVRQVGYKAAWSGVTVVCAYRFYPSSKTCSACGAVKAKLSLAERVFDCDTCGASIDRDVNAAVNLARLGGPASPLGSGPAGTHSVAGRGGTEKTPTRRASAQRVAAQACETSTVNTSR
jgi:putative transposase